MLEQFDSNNTFDKLNSKDTITKINTSKDKAVRAINDKFKAADQFEKKYDIKQNVHNVVDDWNTFMNDPKSRMDIQEEYLNKTSEIYMKNIKNKVDKKYN